MSNINPIGTVTTMTDQSTLVIEHWQTSRLIPYVRNPRKNDHAVEQMAGAITEFGFRIPLIAKSNGELVDGHLRLKAALHLGLDTVPVILADDLTPAQIKAFRLLANRSATWAQWDDDLLRLELDDLKLEDFDLTLTGFDPDELAALLADGEKVQSGNNDDDLVPDLSEEPITKPGDLWLLGPHRLLCGDATTPANVRRLLGNAVPILMVSDPPYGVRYDPGWRNDAGVSSTARIGAVMNDDRADWSEAWALFPGDVCYVWHGGLHADVVKASLESCEFVVRSQIIWNKPRLVLSRGHYHWKHEPCWYAVRKSANGNWQGSRDQVTVWDIPLQNGDEDSATVHGTQKPVECMLRPILNHTVEGDYVYDPFLGSGSTLIAACKSNRRCLAMDIDPAYIDVAVKRWQNYTGQVAIRESDGATFNDLVAEELTAAELVGL